MINTNSKILTLNGIVKAGPFQIFNTNTGQVLFGPGTTEKVYPEWFGAKGDGTTDDTIPVQLAATAAQNRILQFMDKTYKISAPIQLAANSRVYGLGMFKSTIYQSVQNTSTFYVSNDNEIAYLGFTGNGVHAGLGNEVIFFDPTAGGLVGSRVYVYSNYFGNTITVSAIGGNNLKNTWIFDNFLDLGTEAEHGIYISGGSSDVWVLNNIIKRSGVASTASIRGIHIKGSNNLYIRGNHITGTWNSYAITSNDFTSTNLNIEDNTIDGTFGGTWYGIAVGQANFDTNVSIKRNSITGPTYGIWNKAANVTIAENNIYNTGQRGIESDGTAPADTTNTTIISNNLINCTEGIRLQSADANYAVENNVINGGVLSLGIGCYITSGSTDGIIRNNVVKNYAGGGFSFSVACKHYGNFYNGVQQDFNISKGVTGSRPTMPAGAIGQQYLDTTLAANGKPIWWNGTAWVDSTGAAV